MKQPRRQDVQGDSTSRDSAGGFDDVAATNWPDGLPRTLEYPQLPMTSLFRGAASTWPNRTALDDGDTTMTYKDLLASASRLAHALRDEAGVREGDVVALHAPNGIHHPIGWFGILLAGATVSLLSPLQPAEALGAQLDEVGAVAVLSHPDCIDNMLEAVEGSGARIVVLLQGSAAHIQRSEGQRPVVELENLTAGRANQPPIVTTGPDDVALLSYTGGTTGTPKPVQILHRNCLSNLLQIVAGRAGSLPEPRGSEVRLRSSDRSADFPVRIGESVGLILSPLYHQHALNNLNFMLSAGMTAVIAGRFDPKRTLDLVEHHRVDYMTTAPAAYHALLQVPDVYERDLTSVRSLTSGAGPMDVNMHAALSKAFPNGRVFEGYGLTETTATATFPPTTPDTIRKVGTVGVPLADTAIEIRDLQQLDRALPVNSDGEVWIKGPQVAAGYLGHPELTAEQFTDGWLRTGDIGRLDEDGYLSITGRLKEMLIYKGYNIYPRELEELLTALDGINQAAVVGRPHPANGELPVAFVVAEPSSTLTEDDIRARVAAQVPPYKRLSEVVFIDRLPTSATGKILKNELKEQLNA